MADRRPGGERRISDPQASSSPVYSRGVLIGVGEHGCEIVRRAWSLLESVEPRILQALRRVEIPADGSSEADRFGNEIRAAARDLQRPDFPDTLEGIASDVRLLFYIVGAAWTTEAPKLLSDVLTALAPELAESRGDASLVGIITLTRNGMTVEEGVTAQEVVRSLASEEVPDHGVFYLADHRQSERRVILGDADQVSLSASLLSYLVSLPGSLDRDLRDRLLRVRDPDRRMRTFASVTHFLPAADLLRWSSWQAAARCVRASLLGAAPEGAAALSDFFRRIDWEDGASTPWGRLKRCVVELPEPAEGSWDRVPRGELVEYLEALAAMYRARVYARSQQRIAEAEESLAVEFSRGIAAEVDQLVTTRFRGISAAKHLLGPLKAAIHPQEEGTEVIEIREPPGDPSAVREIERVRRVIVGMPALEALVVRYLPVGALLGWILARTIDVPAWLPGSLSQAFWVPTGAGLGVAIALFLYWLGREALKRARREAVGAIRKSYQKAMNGLVDEAHRRVGELLLKVVDGHERSLDLLNQRVEVQARALEARAVQVQSGVFHVAVLREGEFSDYFETLKVDWEDVGRCAMEGSAAAPQEGPDDCGPLERAPRIPELGEWRSWVESTEGNEPSTDSDSSPTWKELVPSERSMLSAFINATLGHLGEVQRLSVVDVLTDYPEKLDDMYNRATRFKAPLIETRKDTAVHHDEVSYLFSPEEVAADIAAEFERRLGRVRRCCLSGDQRLGFVTVRGDLKPDEIVEIQRLRGPGEPADDELGAKC